MFWTQFGYIWDLVLIPMLRSVITLAALPCK